MDVPSLEELTIEELEALLELKRQQAREEGEDDGGRNRREGQLHTVQLSPLMSPLEAKVRTIAQARERRWLPDPTRWRGKVLLAVEIAALVALVVVIIGSLLELQLLNRELAEIQREGASASNLTTEVELLPGSSFPSTTAATIPERYRNLIQPVNPVPIPTSGPQQAKRIVIPAIGVDAPVVEGDGWEELKKGAGHHIGSADPGQRGNVVITAHNDVFGEIFRHLGELQIGDEVLLYTSSERVYKYVVKGKRIVEPTEVSVMQNTTEPTLTLITCYPYLIDNKRMVVFAQLSH
ncbi:MAG: sortase [Anaerolineae bacterium]